MWCFRNQIHNTHFFSSSVYQHHHKNTDDHGLKNISQKIKNQKDPKSQNKCKIFGHKTLSPVLKVKEKSPPNPPQDGSYAQPKPPTTTKNPSRTTWNYLNHREMVAISVDRGGKEVMMAAAAVVCSMIEMLRVFGERKKWRENKEKQACVCVVLYKLGLKYMFLKAMF